MKKSNMLILILVMLSATTLTGYALAAESGTNISPNETIATITPADAIAVNEDVNVINITRDSNETTVDETIIKEEQMKSSPGFSLTDTVMSLITGIILIMIFKGRDIK